MQELRQAAIPIANYRQTIALDAERILVEDAAGRHEAFFRDISVARAHPLFFPVLRIVPVVVADVYLLMKDSSEVRIFNISRSTAEAIILKAREANMELEVVREPLRRGIGNFSGYLMRSLDRQANPGVPHASLPAAFIVLDIFWMLVLFGLLGYGLMRMF